MCSSCVDSFYDSVGGRGVGKGGGWRSFVGVVAAVVVAVVVVAPFKVVVHSNRAAAAQRGGQMQPVSLVVLSACPSAPTGARVPRVNGHWHRQAGCSVPQAQAQGCVWASERCRCCCGVPLAVCVWVVSGSRAAPSARLLTLFLVPFVLCCCRSDHDCAPGQGVRRRAGAAPPAVCLCVRRGAAGGEAGGGGGGGGARPAAVVGRSVGRRWVWRCRHASGRCTGMPSGPGSLARTPGACICRHATPAQPAPDVSDAAAPAAANPFLSCSLHPRRLWRDLR